jgi:AhpD family alkylhydroperoxidase
MDNFYDKHNVKHIRRLRELKPELYKAFMDFDRATFKDGALSGKVKHLAAVSVAHVTQCPWCIDVHVSEAKKAGATDEEIAEAVFVAMAMRAGASFSHAAISMGVAEEHKE